jgi:hypothetical protein
MRGSPVICDNFPGPSTRVRVTRGIYWPVERRGVCIYSQVTWCPAPEAAEMGL